MKGKSRIRQKQNTLNVLRVITNIKFVWTGKYRKRTKEDTIHTKGLESAEE